MNNNCSQNNFEKMDTKKRTAKRIRKKLSINKKMAILNELCEGKRVIDIAKMFNINECTVRAIKKNEGRIKLCASNISTNMADKNVHIRNPLIHKFENLLYLWIKDQRQKGISLSTSLIQTKANSLYAEMISQSGENSKASSFTASRGWFQKFKERFNLRNVNVHNEADSVPIPSYKSQFLNTMEENGYYSKPDYNMDETGLLWKKPPTRTYVTEDETNINNEELMQLEHQSFVEVLLDESGPKTEHTARTNEQLKYNPNNLVEFIQAADHLKELIATVETDVERIDGFRYIIDGAIFYYHKKLDSLNKNAE